MKFSIFVTLAAFASAEETHGHLRRTNSLTTPRRELTTSLISLCNGRNICDLDNGSYKLSYYRIKDDGNCEEKCEPEAKALDEITNDGFTCGACPICPMAGPVCEHDANGVPMRLHMNHMSGGQCVNECVELKKIAFAFEEGWSCGLCDEETEYCPIENACETFNDGSAKKIWMHKVEPDKCNLACVEVDKINEYTGKDYTCGYCPHADVCPENELIACKWRDKGRKSYWMTDGSSCSCVDEEKMFEEKMKNGMTCGCGDDVTSDFYDYLTTEANYFYTGNNDGHGEGCGNHLGPAPLPDDSNLVVKFFALGDTPYDGLAKSCIVNGESIKPCPLYNCQKPSELPLDNTCTWEGSDFACVQDTIIPYMKSQAETAAFAMHIGDFVKVRLSPPTPFWLASFPVLTAQL